MSLSITEQPVGLAMARDRHARSARSRRYKISPYACGVPQTRWCARESEHMCDQDHFEKDREEYEALGWVTRKQFGMVLGAGIAMMLPQAANAVAVSESDV